MMWRAWRCRPRWRMVAIKESAGCLFTAPDRVAQVEAEKNAMLGPRRRREVTYNEARLAKQTALEASGLTPVKEGADEDFAPTATAGESSDNNSSGSEVDEGADNVAGSRKVCSASMLGNWAGNRSVNSMLRLPEWLHLSPAPEPARHCAGNSIG